jgi:hypothetical protein
MLLRRGITKENRIPEHEIRNLQDDSDFIVDSLLEFQLWKEDSHGFDVSLNPPTLPGKMLALRLFISVISHHP